MKQARMPEKTLSVSPKVNQTRSSFTDAETNREPHKRELKTSEKPWTL